MTDIPCAGEVSAGFEQVRSVFLDVLGEQPGTGASVAAWFDGDWVVDLWGGWADASHTRPWGQDTLVMPYSVSKPFAAVCVLLLADRGELDLDAPVQAYWPELRARTTVRELLAHRAGLVVLDVEASGEELYDWDRMCTLLAEQEPAWEPGTAQGESALFYGHLLGEIVRRVDGRPLGRFLRDEVCAPLGLDFHVGLGPQEQARAAELTGFGEAFRVGGGSRGDLYDRALGNPPGALEPAVVNGERWRAAEVPAVNGHGTARSVAGLYVALEQGSLLRPGMLAQLTESQGPAPDLVIGGEREWGLGVALDPDGFGMGGVGGSFGWWSRQGRYAFAFLTGHIGDYERGDRLENAVREAMGLPAL